MFWNLSVDVSLWQIYTTKRHLATNPKFYNRCTVVSYIDVALQAK